MSHEGTTKMIRAYRQRARPKRFLSSHLQTPAQNFHRSRNVTIDIQRGGEDVAIAITSLKSGGRYVEETEFTNKEFTPPVFKQRSSIHSVDLLEREVGEHRFQDPNYAAAATNRIFSKFSTLEDTIRRSIELMTSEMFQVGVVHLRDENGNTVHVIDFKPKSSHFPTAATDWGDTGYDPYEDLGLLSDVVRNDGLVDPNKIIIGMNAYNHLLAFPKFKEQLDNRRMQVGEVVRPQRRGEGATFRGWINIGHYEFEIWTYNGGYRDPQSGLFVPFVHPDNVIMTSDEARYDLSFGAIPRLVPPDARVLSFIPSRIANPEGGMDMFTDAWVGDDNQTVIVQVAARPLTIPTGIDTYGCLHTQAA